MAMTDDSSWRAKVFEQRNRSTDKLFLSLKGKRFQYCKIKMYFFSNVCQDVVV